MIVIVIVCSIICIIGIITWLTSRSSETYISSEYEPETKMMTVKYRMREGRIINKIYVGEVTVWYTYPDYDRCDTLTECFLAKLYAKWKYTRSK